MRSLVARLRGLARGIGATGLFDNSAYRQAHLRFSPLRRWPALHYALIGERLGRRPNASFDPRHYRRALQAAGCRPDGSLLAFYAAQGATRDESPSAEFEHRWYAWPTGRAALGAG